LDAESEIKPLLQQSITRLLDYCSQSNWSGFDPFDGLNSRIFNALPFVQNRIGRLVFIQAMKRSPLNFRPIFLVPKEENPKGIAVFCSALLILSKAGFINNNDTILHLLKRLIAKRSKVTPHYCWGYNFDWQSRAFFLPKFVPNIICTTFAGNALLDAYEKFGDSSYLDKAISAGNFLLDGLNITRTDDGICFSYTPLDHGQVHNANLLGAAFLSRLYSLTQEKRFLETAQSAVRYSIRAQSEDGSWAYGEDKTQKWIDNFHTGYNLSALKKFSEYTGNAEYSGNIRKGFQFYKANLFTDDGLPKYFHNKLYPIDIHAVSQSIMTMVEFKAYGEGNINLANRIFIWSMKTMHSKTGYFFYQKKRYFTNRIPYMRWSQAWILLALSKLLEDYGQNTVPEPPDKFQV
jgi:hypothetical protein